MLKEVAVEMLDVLLIIFQRYAGWKMANLTTHLKRERGLQGQKGREIALAEKVKNPTDSTSIDQRGNLGDNRSP